MNCYIILPAQYILAFCKKKGGSHKKFSLRFSVIYSLSQIDMSRRAGKESVDQAEQQRLHDEAEARRVEALRLEIEQQPTPPEVLQYVSPPLPNVSWTPFGFSGDPEVSQDDLWRDLGRDVQISYDDMNRVINKEERQEGEESSSSSDDEEGGGGGDSGGEEDISVPQVLKRGRRSTSGSGFVVNVRGKFDILIYIM